jgi:flagellar protein FliO/FliZ
MPNFVPLISALFLEAPLAAAPAPAPTPAYLAQELGQLGQGGAASSPAAAAPSLLPTLLNVLFSLAFVVLVVYLAYWLLLKWRNRQGLAVGQERVGLIKVLEKQYLDPRHGVAVVELGDEIFYLGLGDDITLLGKVTGPEAVERLRQQAPLPASFLGFQQQLDRVGLRLKQEEWKGAKRSLKTQADDLQEQVERLRKPKRDQGN